MEKVIYCKNCKYFGWNSFGEKRCKFKIETDTDARSKAAGMNISEGDMIYKSYGEINKNNDCKYYKPKWWAKRKETITIIK